MGEGLQEQILSLQQQECKSDFENRILELYRSFEASELSQDEILLLEALLKMRELGKLEMSTQVQNQLLLLNIDLESIRTCSMESIPEPSQKMVPISDIPGISVEQMQLAKSTLETAIERVIASRRFRTITGYSRDQTEELVQKYLPLMIKESHLDPEAVSNSGAIGYFQLKDGAVSDALDFIRNRLNIRSIQYDVNIPEDNCVLGIMYYERVSETIQGTESLYEADREKFTRCIYNMGLGNFDTLRERYFSENETISLLTWDTFATWYSQKMGEAGVSVGKEDEVYGGKYRDWFGGNDYSQNQEIFLDTGSILKSKIFEAINYVEKIENISNFFFDIPAQETETQFVGEVEYEKVALGSGQSITELLRSRDLDISFAIEVFDFNKLNNPAFSSIISSSSIPVGTSLFIPKIDSGFYESTGEVQESVETGSFDFDKWIDSIEVIGNRLEGKVFVLDPGHGGPDLGAHPIARDAEGNPISDLQSAVRYISEGNTQRVKNPGDGSDYLHVYESLVTLDISYRLALLLRQQGAKVHITRYNRNTGIIETANMTTPAVNDDVYSDTRESWEYSRDGNQLRLQRGAYIAEEVYEKFKLSNGTDGNIFFLSIHADSQSTESPLPIKFLYQSSVRGGISETGRDFAEALALNTTFRDMEARVAGQGLYIVNPNNNPIPQSVLVELGNMNDPGTAYVLRQPGNETIRGRKQFAEALYNGILRSLTSGK